MVYYTKLLFITGLMYLLSPVSSFAVDYTASLSQSHHTPPMSLEPSSLVTSNSYHIAAIYWLPDYMKSNLGTSSSTDNGGGDLSPDITGKCGTYNMVESCGLPKISAGQIMVKENLYCQKGCVCPSSYQYTSSNCSGDKQPGGSICDGKYNLCTEKPCPTNQSCSYGCKTYSSMAHCSSVCTECSADPCPDYYECGGNWQYCTGRKCSADSTKCSTYCTSDYFPTPCDSASRCNGVYRNGYCSGSCTPADPCASVSCGSNSYCSNGSCICNSGYTMNGGTCVKNCTPQTNETGCSYGTENCSDGCGGTRKCCKAAPTCPTNLSCSYGCKTYSSITGCSDRCTECKPCTPSTDETGCTYGTYNCSDGCSGTRKCCNAAPNCPNAQSCTYGCKTYSTTAGCTDVCTECYSDNCRNRTDNTGNYGCQTKWGDCSSKCQTAYADNCRNRTSQSCTYGCQNNYFDCSAKCETCYSDNCRNRTAITIPSNGSCSSYFPDCSGKCSDFSCKSGYRKSGSSCVEIKCSEVNSSYYDSVPTNTVCNSTYTYYGKDCHYNCYYYYTGRYSDTDNRSIATCSYYSFMNAWTYNGSYSRDCYLSNGVLASSCWSQSGRYSSQAECEKERLTPTCMTYKCLTGQGHRSYPYKG